MTTYQQFSAATGRRLMNGAGGEPHDRVPIVADVRYDGINYRAVLIALWCDEEGARDPAMDQVVLWGPAFGNAAGPAEVRAARWAEQFGVEFDD